MINSDELLFVVDEYDVPLAPITRHKTHKHGYWHRAAHVWVVNSKGQILCQKRSALKDKAPNIWEPCVGGHINWQDDYFAGAVKEVREETGLKIEKSDLKLIKIYQDEEFKEFRAVFVYRTDCGIEEIVPEPEEVDEVKWVDVDTMFKAKDWLKMGYEEEILSVLMSRGAGN